MNKNQTFTLNWKKISEKLDLCIKLEKITNRTFALNWKNFKNFQKSKNKNLPKVIKI